MKISTKGRYGTRAMLALAANYDHGLIPAGKIASDEAISAKYLENLLSTLRGAGLVASERGVHGGYALARPPAQISVLDVLAPLEDSLDIVHCTEDGSGCERSSICVTREVWKEVRDAAVRILSNITLEDLLRRQSKLLNEVESGEKAP